MTSKPLKHTPEKAKTPTARPDAGNAGEAPGNEADDPAPTEVGGRDGPDPTRYGDWEKNGRCIDF